MTFNNVGNEPLKHAYGKTKTLDSISPQGGLEIFLVGECTDALGKWHAWGGHGSSGLRTRPDSATLTICLTVYLHPNKTVIVIVALS